MQLTFQHSHKVCDGHEPSGFHYADEQLFVMFNNAANTLQYVMADVPAGIFEGITYTVPADAIYFEDPDVSYQKSYSYSGLEHWINWRTNPTHRIAKYLYKLYVTPFAYYVDEFIRLDWDIYWEHDWQHEK